MTFYTVLSESVYTVTWLHAQCHNTKYKEHVCLPVKRIFFFVELRPQTPPINKREIGDAAIAGERRIHAAPLPQLRPLSNEHAVSSDVTLRTLRSGRIASLSSRSLERHAPSI